MCRNSLECFSCTNIKIGIIPQTLTSNWFLYGRFLECRIAGFLLCTFTLSFVIVGPLCAWHRHISGSGEQLLVMFHIIGDGNFITGWCWNCNPTIHSETWNAFIIKSFFEKIFHSFLWLCLPLLFHLRSRGLSMGQLFRQVLSESWTQPTPLA